MQDGTEVQPGDDTVTGTKLIITLYDKARCTQLGAEDGLNSAPGSPRISFASLFAEIAPTYEEQSHEYLTPDISQAIYITHGPQLLHFASLRHT